MLQVLTTDKETFLKEEWKSVYKQYFNSFKEFKEVMSENIKACDRCQILFWVNGEKRCNHGENQ